MTLYVAVHIDEQGEKTVRLSPAACTLTKQTLEPLRSVLRPEVFLLLLAQALD